MKNIVIFITIVLAAVIMMPPSVTAQRANFDSDRMERDLRIMERIYTDLQRQAMGVMGAANARSVSGGYFPGYGVIFNVNETFSTSFVLEGSIMRAADMARTSEDQFFRGQRYSSEAERRFFEGGNRSTSTDSLIEVREVAVTGYTPTRKMSPDSLRFSFYEKNKEVIRDFFANYADAIAQLEDDDRIQVMISHRGSTLSYAFVTSGSRIQSATQNPLRAEVRVGDIVAYRTGNIGLDAFHEKITFSEIDPNSSDNKELQVMRGVFDSALKNSKVSRFNLTKDAQGVLLTNFGAMFSLEVGVQREVLLAGFNPSNISSVEILKNDDGGETIILLKDSTRIVLPSNIREHQVAGVVTSTSTRGRTPQGVVTIAERPSDVRAQTVEGEYVSFRESMDKLIDQVSELLLDYGRTLRSLKSEDKVLVTINQSTTVNDPEVPNRVEIEVDVQTLREFDRGSMNRDSAMKKVVVRRY
jgi:hypothetical protein